MTKGRPRQNEENVTEVNEAEVGTEEVKPTGEVEPEKIKPVEPLKVQETGILAFRRDWKLPGNIDMRKLLTSEGKIRTTLEPEAEKQAKDILKKYKMKELYVLK